MTLKQATGAAIAGICCIFVLRTGGTFAPGFFANLLIARISTTIALAAAIAILSFYVAFYRHLDVPGEERLRGAALLAIAGDMLMVALHLKAFIVVNINRAPLSGASGLFEAVAQITGTLLVMLFFITFYRETPPLEPGGLKGIVRVGLIGAAVGFSVRLVATVNYLLSGAGVWIANLPRSLQLWFLPGILISVACFVYFFVSFYRYLGAAAKQ